MYSKQIDSLYWLKRSNVKLGYFSTHKSLFFGHESWRNQVTSDAGKQLSVAQRYTIETLKARGESNRIIAKTIAISSRTVDRELKRNTGLRGYRHKQNQEKPYNDAPPQALVISGLGDGNTMPP